MTNTTQCLSCQKEKKSAEPFFDLSVNIQRNVSISSCLRRLEEKELLEHTNKLFCEDCKENQETEKSHSIQKLPAILQIHLKRLQYNELYKSMIKLNWQVAFPFEIILKCTRYRLYALIVHIGPGLFGHYVALVSINEQWVQFDDDQVTVVDQRYLFFLFGNEWSQTNAYMLFYERMP